MYHVFLNQVCAAEGTGFLKLLWFLRQYVCVCVCVSVCLSVCLPPRALITSGIWCDIGRVQLVKQVS